MREIKEFVDMMESYFFIKKARAVEIAKMLRRLDDLEQAFSPTENDDDRLAMSDAYYLECMSYYNNAPKEYKALKALVDKPLAKVEVTRELQDEAFLAACEWLKKTFPNGEEKYPHPAMIDAALQAGLDHIGGAGKMMNSSEKPNSSIFDSFPPESPLLDEPNKQTLEEFCIRNTPQGNLDVLTPSEIICLVSEWHQSKNR